MNRQALMVVGMLASTMVGTVAANDITVISFGRADQAALTKAYYRPFHEATGIDVISFSYDGQTTELEQMRKTGKTTWDVIQVESRTLELGCRDGLFEKLDFSKIGSKSDFIPGAVSDCGIGIFAWSIEAFQLLRGGICLLHGIDQDKKASAPEIGNFYRQREAPHESALMHRLQTKASSSRIS